MVNHDPIKVDNLLVEWICALECFKITSNIQTMSNEEKQLLQKVKIQRILPIIFGRRVEGVVDNTVSLLSSSSPSAIIQEDTSLITSPIMIITNLFQEGILDRLSKEIPLASLHFAYDLLKKEVPYWKDGSPSFSYSKKSVQDIVKQMISFLCILAWEKGQDFSQLVASCAEEACRSLKDILATHNTLITSTIDHIEEHSSSTSAASVSSTGHSVMSLLALIKNEYELMETGVNEIIDIAFSLLSTKAQEEFKELRMSKPKEKLLFIAKELKLID